MNRRNLHKIALGLGMLTCGLAHAAGPGWQPDKTVEFIVGSAPGSSVDAMARVMQNILQTEKIVTVPIIVTNKAGAGSTIAMQYLGQHDGDGHKLIIQASTGLLAAATGTVPYDYFEYTPIVDLVSEPVIVLVRADSPIKDGKAFMRRLKADPGGVSISLKEQGANTVADIWRGMLGPRRLGAAETAYWEDVFGRMVKTKAWRDSLAKHVWQDAFVHSPNSEKTRANHRREFESSRAVLKELGISR